MKIDNKKHQQQPWKVHGLLADFIVEDVWQFPVTLEKEHTIPLFYEQLMEGMHQLMQKGPAGFLFKLRLFLGRIFGWDNAPLSVNYEVPKGSIRERYMLQNNLTPEDFPKGGEEEFSPVYGFENEALAELENKTVHAALHLGKVPKGDKYTVQMAVYVKHKGWLSKLYMALIKPFRLIIVYPTMMHMVGKHWAKLVEVQS